MRPAGREKSPGQGDTCFSRTQKADFRKYFSDAVLPAADCILSWLDAGESLSLSVSGLAIEQLTDDETAGSDVLAQVLQHRGVETLGQTYYRSVAGLFSKNDEFICQVSRHADLIEEMAGRRPQVFESTEFVFNSALTDVVRTLGFQAIYSEGFDHLFSSMNPNYVYSCHNLPVFLRNCRLTDDISHRFHDRTWDRHPLTAEKYARWVAETPGDCIHLLLDAGIFSGAGSAGSSFKEFFCGLPEALHSRDVCTAFPSSLVRNPPQGELQLEDLGMCSDTVCTLTGIQNMHQQSAFWCLEDAWDLITDRESCAGSRAPITSPAWPSCQDRAAGSQSGARARRPMTIFLHTCGHLPTAKQPAMHRYGHGSQHGPSGACPLTGRSIFIRDSGSPDIRRTASKNSSGFSSLFPSDVFRFHQERGDFSRWITEVLGDTTLARNVAQCTGPGEAARIVRERCRELCHRLK